VKVYLVEMGCYDSAYIAGVYATPEAAMAAHPVRAAIAYPNGSASHERPGGWQKRSDGTWSNGLDWDYAGDITKYEVEG